VSFAFILAAVFFALLDPPAAAGNTSLYQNGSR